MEQKFVLPEHSQPYRSRSDQICFRGEKEDSDIANKILAWINTTA